MPRLHGHREKRRINFYDSFLPGSNWQVLFKGEQRDLLRSNVLMSTLSSDLTVIENWYARVNFHRTDEAKALWEEYTHTTHVTFRIGDRPMDRRVLFDLLRGRPWVPPSIASTVLTEEEFAAFQQRIEEGCQPLLIPVRQNFCIEVEQTRPEVFERLQMFMAPEQAPIVWIHIEGVQSRAVC